MGAKPLDIIDNEEADKSAKELARSSRTISTIFIHKTMKSARNQIIKRAAKKEWKIEQENGRNNYC